MNNLKRLLVITILFFGSISFGQDNEGVGKVNGSFCLTLQGENDVKDIYIVDATSLNWASEKEADKACGYHSNNLVSYRANFEENKLIVRIHTDRTGEKKDLNWWNEYLASICQ